MDATSTRTYLAALTAQPDLSTVANLAPPTTLAQRATRKQLVASAASDASHRAWSGIAPQLDALRGAGLVRSYELLPYTGTAVVSVDDRRAADAWRALRSVDGIGRITRSRTHELDLPEPAHRNGNPGTVPHIESAPLRRDDAVEWNVARVRAPELWARGIDGAGVVIGMIDSGFDMQHEAIKPHYRGTQPDGSMVHDHNYVDTVDGYPDPRWEREHGTHTTGTALGGTPQHHTGVAPGATFIAAKPWRFGKVSDEAIARGLNWMAAPTDSSGSNPDPTKAPDVISNSWGFMRQYEPAGMREALHNLVAAGIVPVFAAGNEGPLASSLRVPGDWPEVIAVGATRADDTIASFSSRGPSREVDASGTPVPKPDVVAPGENVTSAYAGHQGGYTPLSGTSMAAPAVAGVVALLLSRHPEATTQTIRTALARSARDLGAPGFDTVFGNGLVDAVGALDQLDHGTDAATRRDRAHLDPERPTR